MFKYKKRVSSLGDAYLDTIYDSVNLALDSVGKAFNNPQFYSSISYTPPTNPVVEKNSDGTTTIEVEAPGLKPEDFKLVLKPKELILTYRPYRAKEETTLVWELLLPTKAEEISTSYQDGLLKIIIAKPKAQDSNAEVSIPVRGPPNA